jgi:DNA invertase Pin-like site-specific DNA recombinase
LGSAADHEEVVESLQILAVIAEFEANLIRQRTSEGIAIARDRGKLRGKPPKLSPAQAREVHRMHASGEYPITEIAELFNVSRPTVYRVLQRPSGSAPLPANTRPLPDVSAYDELLPSHRPAAG